MDAVSISPYRDDLIRAAQAALKKTNEELAELSGLSVGTISAIRNGGDARVSSLRKVAFALGVPMPRLFESKQETEQAIA
jgi:transcriptional regulator with XRE-family HTH domain